MAYQSYRIERASLTGIADETRRLTGATHLLSPAEIKQLLSTVGSGCTEASFLHMPVIISDKPQNGVVAYIKIPAVASATLPAYPTVANLTLPTESFCVEEVE